MLTMGAIVLYRLTDVDAKAINRRRGDFRVTSNEAASPWPTGYQAHVGNKVAAGDTYPAVVIRIWDPSVNLQVLLDGNDTYWATSRLEGDGDGTWSWPPRI